MKRPTTILAGAIVALARVATAAMPSLPAEPVAGKIYPVRNDAANDGVRIAVLNASVVKQYGPRKAPPGRAWVVLGTEWENLIPPTAGGADNDSLSTVFKLPKLPDHVYLVLDGRRVARLSADASTSPGHLNPSEFTIPKAGDRLRGNLIFDVPDGPHLGWAELRFYDTTYGPLTVPLGDIDGEKAAKEPITPLGSPQNNAILEAAVFGIDKPPADSQSTDVKPGAIRTVKVDFRARSVYHAPPPPAAKSMAGRTVKPPPQKDVATVVDWPELRKYVTLVVDNEYAYAPLASPTDLSDAPRFIPDVATGGTLSFRVPAEARLLALHCEFASAVPGGKVTTPRAFDLDIAGSRFTTPDLKPVVPAIVDTPYFVAVTRVDTAANFADQPAGDGKQFLVVSVTVANTGQAGEFFQTRQQLKFLTSKGEQQPMDALAKNGPRPPLEVLLVPAGQRRSFQAVYRVDLKEPALRLAYAGVTKGEIIALPGGTGDGAVATVHAPSPTTKSGDAVAIAPPPRKPLAADEPLTRQNKSFPSRVSARQNRSPKGIAGVGLTPQQVNGAIDRGAAALWGRVQDRLKKDKADVFGSDPTDVVVALALVHAKYHKKDATFDKALRGLLARYNASERPHTDENGLAAMLIEGYGDRTFVPQLAATAQWIVDQQGPAGTWNYGRRVNSDEPAAAGARRVLTVTGGHPPDESARGTQALRRRTAAIDYDDGDNSVSQYALLGLFSATRSGFELPRETFASLLNETRSRQNPDGGWAYHGSGGSYGSMTCAGICAVALTRFELGEKEPWKDESVQRGLAWLNAYFRVDDHPESLGQWQFYYLYSLERVGRILDTEFIGDHEWYPEGARWLVDHQREAGLWWSDHGGEEGSKPEIASSFALLFLTRATANLGERVIPQGPGTLTTTALLPPGNRLYVILDCSGSMLDQINGQEKFTLAKDAVRALLKDMPDNSDVALRAYGYRLRAIQPGANEDTKLLVPLKTIDRKEMAGFVEGLRARGETPMALSLEQAAQDLRNAATPERPITAVLLTDGGEDTQPRKDPVAAAAAFATLANVKLHIVGFDINRAEWTTQLNAMAAAAGGEYLPASRGEQLQKELRAAVFATPENAQVLDAQGKVLRTLAFGEQAELPPGKYRFATEYAGRQFEQPFYISPGETTTITFDAGAIAEAANAAKAASQPPTPPAAAPTAGAAGKPVSKFCVSCGRPLAIGAKFCTHCGTKIGP